MSGHQNNSDINKIKENKNKKEDFIIHYFVMLSQ